MHKIIQIKKFLEKKIFSKCIKSNPKLEGIKFTDFRKAR